MSFFLIVKTLRDKFRVYRCTSAEGCASCHQADRPETRHPVLCSRHGSLVHIYTPPLSPPQCLRCLSACLWSEAARGSGQLKDEKMKIEDRPMTTMTRLRWMVGPRLCQQSRRCYLSSRQCQQASTDRIHHTEAQSDEAPVRIHNPSGTGRWPSTWLDCRGPVTLRRRFSWLVLEGTALKHTKVIAKRRRNFLGLANPERLLLQNGKLIIKCLFDGTKVMLYF